MYEVLKVSELG